MSMLPVKRTVASPLTLLCFKICMVATFDFSMQPKYMHEAYIPHLTTSRLLSQVLHKQLLFIVDLF
jgi:hypothetical protein